MYPEDGLSYLNNEGVEVYRGGEGELVVKID
jgi:hypothetical protein